MGWSDFESGAVTASHKMSSMKRNRSPAKMRENHHHRVLPKNGFFGGVGGASPSHGLGFSGNNPA